MLRRAIRAVIRWEFTPSPREAGAAFEEALAQAIREARVYAPRIGRTERPTIH